MTTTKWETLPLHKVAEIRTGIAKGKKGIKNPVSVPYLRVANVQDGAIDLSVIKTIEVEQSQLQRYALQKGDVLMTEGGDFDKLGRGDVWQGEISPCLHQNHVFAVRPNKAMLNPYFLAALSSSVYGKTYFLSCAKRSTNLASINSTQIKSFPVFFPGLCEQNTIVSILSLWDAAIACTKKLLENSKQQKKSLVQQLLTGRRRLPGFSKNWQRIKLGKLFMRVTTRNGNQCTNVVTISAQQGLIRQEDFFNKTVASSTLDNYFLIKNGDFAYNKSYSKGYPFGAIKRLNKYEYGVVTSLYICFSLHDTSQGDKDFFEHFFEYGSLNHALEKIAHEGGRAHGLLNVKPGDFFSIQMTIPPSTNNKPSLPCSPPPMRS